MLSLSKYPTFDVFVAIVLGAVFTVVLMPPFIRFLQKRLIGQQVRADGPESHLVKQGTPTMGGVIMLAGMCLAVLLLDEPTAETGLIMFAVLATAALGFIDDFTKVVKERSLGLTPKMKLVGQFVISTIFVLAAVNVLGVSPIVNIPFICDIDLGVLTTVVGGVSIPWLYVIFVDILIMGMSNATNLTDGLDGLAAGTVMVVMMVMAAIAFRVGLLDSAVIAASMAGCCIGFLWYNSYPADIFMGDTGSLALGTCLACVAVVSKTEVVSLIIGGLFVVEALSVMLQVFYYKRTHKRLFLMAPLHHHFEKKGWSEVKVVIRFWIVSGSLAALGFALFFAQTI